MAKVTKKAPVFRDHNGAKRPVGPVVFDENDAGVGDILMVRDSLGGRPASHVSIDATAAISVKFNVVQTIYPLRKQGEGFSEPDTGYRNIGQGVEYIASGEAYTYALGAGETLELDGEFPIEDIMVTAGATDYVILVS